MQGVRPRQDKEIGFYVETLASRSVPNIRATLISETANAKSGVKHSSIDYTSTLVAWNSEAAFEFWLSLHAFENTQ